MILNHIDTNRRGERVTARLTFDIFKGSRRSCGEADEEDVRLWVGQGTQSIVILLSCRVPEVQDDRLAVHHDVGRVVVVNRRNVLMGKGVGRVRDQQTRLPYSTDSGDGDDDDGTGKQRERR